MSLNLLILIGAKYLFVVVPVVALIYWITASSVTKRYLVVFGIAVGLFSVLIGQVIAYFYFDPRPFVTGHFQPLIPHAPDNGFPSDHTLLSSVIAATITTANPLLGLVLWAVTALVAAARVSAGLHRPIDVIGSVCIAGLAAVVARWALRSRPFETLWRKS